MRRERPDRHRCLGNTAGVVGAASHLPGDSRVRRPQRASSQNSRPGPRVDLDSSRRLRPSPLGPRSDKPFLGQPAVAGGLDGRTGRPPRNAAPAQPTPEQNRFLRGLGIGLDTENWKAAVRIEPGIALDPHGEELTVEWIRVHGRFEFDLRRRQPEPAEDVARESRAGCASGANDLQGGLALEPHSSSFRVCLWGVHPIPFALSDA